MSELEKLKQELLMIFDNITKVQDFVKCHNTDKYKPYQSREFGELKHRLVVFKQTCLSVQKLSTSKLYQDF